MKTFIHILLSFIAFPTFAQNIWGPVNFPDTLNAKAINAEQESLLFVATGGDNEFYGLFRSFDDGTTWEKLEVYPSTPYINIHTIRCSPEGALYLGTAGSIYRSYDHGVTFERLLTGEGNILKINFSPTDKIYAVGWNNILRSSDNGISWDTLYLGVSSQYFGDIDFGINGEIYAVSQVFEAPGSGFYRSLDDGVSWENIGITDYPLYSVRVNHDGVIIVSGDYGISKSNDCGLSWVHLANISAEVMESDKHGNLFAGQYNWGSGCWFSENWGETWISLEDTIVNLNIRQISVSPDNTVYVQSTKFGSTDPQLFKSINPILNVSQKGIISELDLVPNPAKTRLAVLNNFSCQIFKYVVYNQNGQNVLYGLVSDGIIDISKLQPGMYFIELECEKNIFKKKFVIE